MCTSVLRQDSRRLDTLSAGLVSTWWGALGGSTAQENRRPTEAMAPRSQSSRGPPSGLRRPGRTVARAEARQAGPIGR